ncbi:MAG: thiol:disulfide interchange protein DsbA/DsbL [Gammaproteobacteria bacterium]|nr:thiol:disulfide interchange protein DsbA/DsbL [Gammaproteobacteria bacterium]MBU1416234.1 thiol:disulfide interchange protein DsbA/DsbL [Gammaproteobacteria bacterium]
MRKITWIVGAAIIAFANLAGAVDLKEGGNYVTYNPPRATDVRDRIEVTEFFWYGCSHCFHLEPELQKWLKRLPKDVVFRRVPAVFPGRDGTPGQWASGSALYFALDAMGYGEKLHGDIFKAIQVERADLLSEKGMVNWLGKKGVDTKAFSATYQSFAVRSKVLRAMQLSQAYGLDGVPALTVDGRYRAIAGEDMLAVTDALIDKARKDRGK